MKLRCLKKTPVILQEMGFKKVIFGDIFDGRDETNANMLIEKYPGCFEKVLNEEAPKLEFNGIAKQAKTLKDKMHKSESNKEFS